MSPALLIFKFCTNYFVDGRKEKVMFDKITSRISKLCYGLKEDYVDAVSNVFIRGVCFGLVLFLAPKSTKRTQG